MKKKNKKAQLGNALYAKAETSNKVPLDYSPINERIKTPVFKTKAEFDAYHLEQSLQKLSPEDRLWYEDAKAGRVKNVTPEDIIALRAPTPLGEKFTNKTKSEPMGNVLGRAYGLKQVGIIQNYAQNGKVITGDPMYDAVLNKRDSVIQSGPRGHRDWDIYLKKEIEKVKSQKAKQLQNKIDSLHIIEDNKGQLKHPGKVTKINSNKITMKGVNYPVLGVSDMGDSKLMLPNQDYNFEGSSVTEYPMAKSGIHINPKNKGKFNALKKKTGKSTEELTHSKNPLTRKRAIFAQNAAKWNKGQQGMQLEPIDLNWGSENLTVPGQFTAQGQLEQFNNTLPQQGFLGKVGEQLGGPMGILNTATSLVGGIQQIGQKKEEERQAKQFFQLSKLTKKAASLDPERVKRKYHRPEDQLIDPNEMAPTYGVGTNYLAKDGGTIEYIPYQQGGILNQAGQFFTGIGQGRAGNLGSMLGSAIGGGQGIPSGASQIGSTLGGVAGSFLGPVGGAVGSFIGGTLGGVIGGGTQRSIDRYNRKGQKNLTTAALQQNVNSLQNQYTGFMENGGKMRIGGHLRANKYALGGDLQTYEGGGAAPISSNPYLPDTGETVMFKGASHEEGGIDMKFGGNTVEVEGGEPAVKLKDGGKDNLTIFGNMKIPPFGVLELNDPKAKGKKFKNYIKDLSEKEAKANKIVDKNMLMIDELEVATPFDKLKMSSGEAMLTGANMRLKDIAQKKQTASIVQNAILETADELGLESDALAKGNIKKGKFGKTAQEGLTISRAEVEEYTKQGWQLDPSNPNRMFKKGSTPGSMETISVGAPGKGGEEFNKAFADARKKGLKEFDYKGKPYTTDLYKGSTKTVERPGSEFIDYLDIIDPSQSPRPNSVPMGTPSINAKSQGLNVADFINTALPYLRPSNQLSLDPNQLAGEQFALATNQLEPVQAQLYHPLLEQVSDISLQDQMNANQADFNAIQRTVGNNPAALSVLAGQKYAANSGVLGDQFRLNQQQKQGVYNRNRGTLNDSQLKNLSILDQQYVRQATAKSKTKDTAQAALNSISSKIQQNKLENKTLGVMENLYNYRFGPKGYAYNLNPLAQFEFPSAGDTGNAYLDNLVPIGKEPEFNSRGQLKDVGSKAKKNGGLVKAMKYC